VVLEVLDGGQPSTAEFVRAWPWRGRSGGTDRAVMLALCRMGGTAGRVSGLNASVRAVAVGADIGRSTARKSLVRLRSDGWLRLLKAGAGWRASSWAFLVTQRAPIPHTPPEGEIEGGSLRDESPGHGLDAGDDSFR
jgi:hypothetical protein